MADGGRPITAADLGALFSDRCLVNGDEPRTDAPGDDALLDDIGSDEKIDGPPRYGRRLADAWRPANDAYFGGGGAFPEIHVVQFPAAIGWDARCDEDAARKSRGRGVCSSQGTSQAAPQSPATLDMDFDQLQTIAARMMLRLGPDPNDPTHAPHAANMAAARDVAPRRSTNEWDSFVDFCARVSAHARATRGPSATISAADVVSHLLDSHPNASRVTRVSDPDPATVAETYLVCDGGVGVPVVVTDGGKDWPGLGWSVRELGARFGRSFVRCNDRAPARREDALDERTGGAQRSAALSMLEYSRYCSERPGMDNVGSLRVADAPFYANGLRHGVFEHPETDGVRRGGGSGTGFIEIRDGSSATREAFPAPAFTRLCDQVVDIVAETHSAILPNAPPGARDEMATSLSAGLSKVFVGPCGTVTRLHQDCANAHAWLGQASGRKLFVCYPPSDAEHLDVLEGETETRQSRIDPVAPKDCQPRGYLRDATPTVFVLEPGEVSLFFIFVWAISMTSCFVHRWSSCPAGGGITRRRWTRASPSCATSSPRCPSRTTRAWCTPSSQRRGRRRSVAEFVRLTPRRRGSRRLKKVGAYEAKETFTSVHYKSTTSTRPLLSRPSAVVVEHPVDGRVRDEVVYDPVQRVGVVDLVEALRVKLLHVSHV